MLSTDTDNAYAFLQGGGEMGALTRAYDWAATGLGDPSGWPYSLRTTVSNLLRSRFPMFLWWGKDMIQFYNDAYRPSMGNEGKHPMALGQKGKDCWPEIWDIITPLHQQVETTGEATWMENQLVPIYRNGKIEDVYWTFSYSSVLDDEGRHGGILVTCMETTEAVKVQRKTDEIQQELLALFEEAPVAIATIGAGDDLVFESANLFYGELVGRHPADIIGKPLLEALPELKDQGFDDLLKSVLNSGQAFTAYEVPAQLTRNGKLDHIFVNLTYQPRKNIMGHTSGILVVATDVTPQMLSRRQVEASEARLRSLIEQAPMATCLYSGPNMRIELANEMMLSLWGKDHSVIGKELRDALPELEGQPFHDILQEVYRSGKPYSAAAARADLEVDGVLGTYYFNFTYKPLFNEEGEVYSIMNMAVEVTEQVLASQQLVEKEAALRNAVELAELGTWSMDIETGLTELNDRHAEMFGLAGAGLSYDDAIRVVHPDDLEKVTKAFQQAMEPGSDGKYDAEYRIINGRSGKQQVIRAVGETYFDLDGKPIRIAGTAQDITMHRELQMALEQQVQERTRQLEAANNILTETNRELQRSNAHLEEFAHAASHDLKEPIRKIHFFTQRLKEQMGHSIPESELKSFGRIENATERMGNLIDDLLLYSHVSQQPRQMEPVDLQEVLQHVLEDLELDIQETGAQVNLSAIPEVPGHRRQLQQLFQNLVSNAIKYRKKDIPPVISIHGEATEWKGHPYQLITITDNGIGFEQKYADKIFQMFSRLHGRHEYSGTGVGLSIVKKVVENHKGFIEVTSQPGEGASFKLYLPVEGL